MFENVEKFKQHFEDTIDALATYICKHVNNKDV